jgi:hypothetical protein
MATKAELDKRETAIAEREEAVQAREEAIAEREQGLETRAEALEAGEKALAGERESFEKDAEERKLKYQEAVQDFKNREKLLAVAELRVQEDQEALAKKRAQEGNPIAENEGLVTLALVDTSPAVALAYEKVAYQPKVKSDKWGTYTVYQLPTAYAQQLLTMAGYKERYCLLEPKELNCMVRNSNFGTTETVVGACERTSNGFQPVS